MGDDLYRIIVLSGAERRLSKDEHDDLTAIANKRINDEAAAGFRVKIGLDCGIVGFILMERVVDKVVDPLPKPVPVKPRKL